MTPRILPFYNQPKENNPVVKGLLPLITASLVRTQERRDVFPIALVIEEGDDNQAGVSETGDPTLPAVTAAEELSTDTDTPSNESIDAFQ